MDKQIILVGGPHKKLWTIFQDIEGYDSLGNLSLPNINDSFKIVRGAPITNCITLKLMIIL